MQYEHAHTKKENLDIEMNIYTEIPCKSGKDEGRDRRDASTSPRRPKTASKPLKTKSGPWNVL